MSQDQPNPDRSEGDLPPVPPVPPPPPPAGQYGAPGYGAPGGPGYAYAQPGAIPGQKSKIVAGILGILLGGLGIHRFYLGYTTIGIVQIVVTVLTCGIGAIWGFIEGILILVGSTITTDAQGRPLSDS